MGSIPAVSTARISSTSDSTRPRRRLTSADSSGRMAMRAQVKAGPVAQEFMVLVNEILHNVNQFMKGLPVTEETLALDVIDRVGPGGHYLQDDHTLDHFKDVRYSKLFERMVYDQWKEAGAKRFEDRLRELTREAMEHEPAPLAPEVIKELDKMQKNWK